MQRRQPLFLAASTCAILAFVVVGFVVRDVLADRKLQIRVISNTPLLAERPVSLQSESSIRVIGTLRPGDSVRVLRVRYAKELMAIRVESKQGLGWIVYNSRTVRFEKGGAASGA